MQTVNAAQDSPAGFSRAGGRNYLSGGTDFAALLQRVSSGAEQGTGSTLNVVSLIGTQSALKQQHKAQLQSASRPAAAEPERQPPVMENRKKDEVKAQGQQEDEPEAETELERKADAEEGTADNAQAQQAALLLSDTGTVGAVVSTQLSPKTVLAAETLPTSPAVPATSEAPQKDAAAAAAAGSAAASLKMMAAQQFSDTAKACTEALTAAQAQVTAGQLSLDDMAKLAGVEQVSLEEIKPALSGLMQDAATLAADTQAASDQDLSDLNLQVTLKHKLSGAGGQAGTSGTDKNGASTELKTAAAPAAAAGTEQALQVLSRMARGLGDKSAYNLELIRQNKALSLETQLGAKQAAPGLLMGTAGAGIAADNQELGLNAVFAASSLTGGMSDQGSDSSMSQGQGFNTDLSKFRAQLTKGTTGAADSAATGERMELSADARENAKKIANQVLAMAARNLRQLTIDLNPASLGRMQIAISLNPNNEALAVNIGASQRQTRDLIAKSLSSLKEILAAGQNSGELDPELSFSLLPETAADVLAQAAGSAGADTVSGHWPQDAALRYNARSALV